MISRQVWIELCILFVVWLVGMEWYGWGCFSRGDRQLFQTESQENSTSIGTASLRHLYPRS